MSIVRAAVACALLLLAACASDPPGAESLTWKDAPAGGPAATPVDRATRDSDEVVHVPDEVLRELIGFVNRPQFLIADRIEVDASRIPFQAAMVPVADPGYVDSLELSAPKQKAVGLLLRSRSAMPLVERDFPRLRLGDGTDLVAVKEIAVRTWIEVDEGKPVFIAIRGFGHAIYRDDRSGREIRRDTITLKAEAVPGSGGLTLRTTVN